MSKERLEELAYNVGVSLDGEKSLMSSDDYDFLYNYALEQAERVEKLEKENKLLRFIAEENKIAYEQRVEQIKRYREALEEIANSDGWLIEPNPLCTIEEAYERCVDVAIEALEGEK